jgi:serine/threonine protein kinase
MPQLNPDMIVNGRFQLQRPLGRGGFSIVWLALDITNKNQPVALKISLPDKDPGGEQPIRMENQHNTTRHLAHNNLLRSLEFFMIEDAGCLVFDYMAGGTLHQRVRTNGPLSESEIVKVIAQIGSALQFLHEHSLVHFDVKPENILIDSKGDYFLSDFDTASRLENAMVRVSRIYADTPQYRSPEHLRGAAELSEKVDIFAFGTTLFELCEGIMEKELGIGMMLLSGANKPELTAGKYAKRLENLIHACWNHNPADRPSADALISYADHISSNNFWPSILEYKPDDKPIADLPSGRGAETARVTIGRPTVLNTPPPEVAVEPPLPPRMPTISPLDSPKPVPPSTPAAPFTPSQPASDKMPEKKETNYVRIGLIAVSAVALIAVGIYLALQMQRNNKFKSYLEEATTFTKQNNLKAAYDAINLARELKPDDSTAIKQRREILRIAYEQHTADLELVRGAIDFKDTGMYDQLCQLLNEHKDNASILVADDSTAHFQALLPGCNGVVVAPEDDNWDDTDNTGNTSTNISKPTTTNPIPTTPTETNTNTNTGTTAISPPVTTPEDPAEVAERQKIKEEFSDWSQAKRLNTRDSYQAYLAKWPQGPHATDAQRLMPPVPPVVTKPDPVVDEESIPLPNTKTGALPLSEREQGCKKPVEGGTIVLTANKTIELSELVLFADSPGKVQITLQDASGKKLGATRATVSAGVRAQITLDEIGARLLKGNTYRLVFSPIRNEKGAQPMLENMIDCTPKPREDSNLKIDYQGNFFVFDLKYHF